MNANPDKYHFASSLDINNEIYVRSFDIENTHLQKFLIITIDCKLNFHDYVSNLFKKVSVKTSVIARVFPFTTLIQRKLIMKPILILISVDINESQLQIIIDQLSSAIHHCNLQTLATEIFKLHNNVAAKIMKDVLEIKTVSVSVWFRNNCLFRSLSK